MANEYGPLAETVILGSNLVAAVAALRLAALGRGLWEPDVEGFNRAPVRLAGVVAIVGIAVAFATSRKKPPIEAWIPWTIGCVVVALVFFLADIFARQWLMVKCPGMQKATFTGLWLQPRAQHILNGDEQARIGKDLAEAPPGDPPTKPPASANALYCSFATPRDKTRIWPPTSTAAAVILTVFVYCVWNALATISVGVAATLVALAVTP
jgi:hypothetical protein